MTTDAFISHSSKDANVAGKICGLLEQRGLTCWLAPRNVGLGKSYDEEIVIGIEGATAIVVLISDAANESPHVKSELELAINQGVAILPIRIQDTLPGRNLKFFLSTKQWVDAWAPPIEGRMDEVAEAIKALRKHEPSHPVIIRSSVQSRASRSVATRVPWRALIAVVVAVVVALFVGRWWFQTSGTTSAPLQTSTGPRERAAAPNSVAQNSGELTIQTADGRTLPLPANPSQSDIFSADRGKITLIPAPGLVLISIIGKGYHLNVNEDWKIGDELDAALISKLFVRHPLFGVSFASEKFGKQYMYVLDQSSRIGVIQIKYRADGKRLDMGVVPM